MTTLSADAAVDRVTPRSKPLDKRRFSWGTGILLLPAAVLLISLFVYPVGYAFYLGLTDLELIGPTAQTYHFTGGANIMKMLADPQFWSSLKLTAIFIIGSGVIGATGLGLLLALLMRKANGAVRAGVGAIAILAWMLPPVTISLVWYASTTSGGAIPEVLGLGNFDLLNRMPMLVVCAANTWSLAGMAMLLFGAALRNIPADVDEAAQLEGASALARFLRITLPLLKSTTVTTVLLMTLLTTANFTIVYIMTAGGPGNATMILPVYSYQQAFPFDNLAYGALLGNVVVVLTGILGYAYVRSSRSSV